MTNMITKLELITPERAKELLLLNVANRPINQLNVRSFAKQMKNGQWTTSGQTISISDQNTLIDGQTRLSAIVLSNCPIYLNVAYNVPIESFINLDSGKPRNLSDVMAMSDVPNYNSISAILSKYNMIKFGLVSHLINSGNAKIGVRRSIGVDKNYKYSTKDYLDLYYSNPDLLQRIHLTADKCCRKLKLVSRAVVGGIMYHLINDKMHSEERVFAFFEQLHFNENITNLSVYNLREKLISGSIGNFVLTSKVKYIYLIKGWNAFLLGKEIKKFTYSEAEEMPTFL